MSVPEQGGAAEGDPEATAGTQGPADSAAPPPPSVVRQLTSPAALALADLAAVFEDLQTVLRCCERLVVELSTPTPDDLAVEAYWTTALLSYARCFTPGQRGAGLTEEDVTSTGLEGDVLGWHKVLLAMRDRYAAVDVNPRESFSVGAAQGKTGHAEGIAVSSARQPALDEVSVRQTGAVAYALSGVVDRRLVEQQEVVFTAVAAMARPALDKLPMLHLTTS